MSKVMPLNRGKKVRTKGTYDGLVPSDEEFTLDTSSDEEKVDPPPTDQDDESEYAPLSDAAESSNNALPLAPPPITQGAGSIVIHGKRVDGFEKCVQWCRKRTIETSKLSIVTAHGQVATCSDVKTIDILLLFLKTLADLADQKSDIPPAVLEKVKNKASVQQMIFDWTALLVRSRRPSEASGKYETDATSFQLMMKSDLEEGNELIEVPMPLWVRVFDTAKESSVEIKNLVKVKHGFQCISLVGGYLFGAVVLIVCLIEATQGLEHPNDQDPVLPALGIFGGLGLVMFVGGLYYSIKSKRDGGVELKENQMLRQGNKKLDPPKGFRILNNPTEPTPEGKSNSEEVSPS